MSRIDFRCSTEEISKHHINDLKDLLRKNGYNHNDISKTYQTLRKRKTKNNKSNQHKIFYYYQIPFISDAFNNQLRKIFKKEKINVRIAHRSFTLRNYLKTTNHPNACTLNNCPIKDPTKCGRRNVVYKVECQTCHQSYIGSTIRPLHIRIREHLEQSKSSVYKHLTSCQHHSPSRISTSILAHHREPINLRFMESILIKQHQPEINSKTDFHSLDSLLLWLRLHVLCFLC